jgi:hypothetical protein
MATIEPMQQSNPVKEAISEPTAIPFIPFCVA